MPTPSQGLGIFPSGPVNPLLNLQYISRVSDQNRFPINCGAFTSFFTSTSYRLTTKLTAFTQEIALVWARGSTAAWLGTDWVLWRTPGAAAEWHHSPSHKQPGETRIAKLKHHMLLLKLLRQGACGLFASLFCSSEFSRLHIPFPTFLT